MIDIISLPLERKNSELIEFILQKYKDSFTHNDYIDRTIVNKILTINNPTINECGLTKLIERSSIGENGSKLRNKTMLILELTILQVTHYQGNYIS